MRQILKVTFNKIFLLTFFLIGCNSSNKISTDKLNIVTTTTMITDLVKQIGGNAVNVNGLMGPGIDPHLYKASEGDVNKLHNADLVIYNGLHLEGKLVDVFEKMKQQDVNIVALADTLDHKLLIQSKSFVSNYDPHIWFDIDIWRISGEYVKNTLISQDPKNKSIYTGNYKRFIFHLDSVKIVLKNKSEELSSEKRILITAHDAFQYFGRAFKFKVMGLQGISTVSEAGVKDVQDLADFIVENEVKAIFIESSVPRRNIEALQESVKNKGFVVTIGGELFSDALGGPKTKEGTYTGMFEYNMNTIVNALK